MASIRAYVGADTLIAFGLFVSVEGKLGRGDRPLLDREVSHT